MEGLSQDAADVGLGLGFVTLGGSVGPFAAGGKQHGGEKADDEKGGDTDQQSPCPRFGPHSKQDTADRLLCQVEIRPGGRRLRSREQRLQQQQGLQGLEAESGYPLG